MADSHPDVVTPPPPRSHRHHDVSLHCPLPIQLTLCNCVTNNNIIHSHLSASRRAPRSLSVVCLISSKLFSNFTQDWEKEERRKNNNEDSNVEWWNWVKRRENAIYYILQPNSGCVSFVICVVNLTSQFLSLFLFQCFFSFFLFAVDMMWAWVFTLGFRARRLCKKWCKIDQHISKNRQNFNSWFLGPHQQLLQKTYTT